MSESFNPNSMFVNDSLDSFLADLSVDPNLNGVSSRACALPNVHESFPSSRVKAETAGNAFILKEFEGPAFISCFDKSIQLSSSETESKKTKFFHKSVLESNVVTLSRLRVPTPLKTCFVKNVDFQKEEKKLKIESTKKKLSLQLKFRNRRKSRRNRFSLLENELDNDDFSNSRNVIPTSNDIREMYDKLFPGRGIPYVFGCQGSSDDAHCAVKCGSRAMRFGLFMEVRYAEGRPMAPLVRENVAKIQNESGVIDHLSALIAVSAVKTPEPSKTRLIIPISYDLAGKIAVVQNSTQIQLDCKIKTDGKYDPEVHEVVKDILKFVDRQSEFEEIHYDPDSSSTELVDDPNKSSELSETASPNKSSPTKRRKRKSKIVRELAKLMNVSVTDETVDVGEDDGTDECAEQSCALGCICSSINDKPVPQDHCGNVECMFKCNCTVRYSYVAEGELSKHEKSWHQRVVRKKNNDVEFQSGIERSKRRKKAPLKYEDAITGRQIDQCFRIRKVRDSSLEQDSAPKRRRHAQVAQKIPPDDQNKEQEDQDKPRDVQKKAQHTQNETQEHGLTAREMGDEFCQATGKGVSVRRESSKKTTTRFDRAISEKRLAAVGNQNSKTLDFMYIWCCIHDKYDCYCLNWVIMAKTNALILKPSRNNRFSAKKRMEKVSLGVQLSPDARHVILFDSVAQCSRSAGCLVNYRARNASEIFNNLMKSKIEHDVLSYSNGFIKAQPVATIVPEDILPNHPFVSKPNQQVHGIGEVVKMSGAPAEDEILNVVDAPVGEPLPADDLFEDLQINCVSTTSKDLNDQFEYHPKPHLKKRSATFRPCFSLYKPPNTNKRSPKPRARKVLAETDDESNSDSDLEIIENEWDVVSLSSSSSEDEVDDSEEDSIVENCLSQISLSNDGSVMVTKSKRGNSPQVGQKRPNTLEVTVLYKKLKEGISENDVLESVSSAGTQSDVHQVDDSSQSDDNQVDNSNQSDVLQVDDSNQSYVHQVDDSNQSDVHQVDDEPIVIESDEEEVVVVEDDDDEACDNTGVSTPPVQAEEVSIIESKEDELPSPRHQDSPTPSEEGDEVSHEPPIESEYPDFGLFCMDHPELGYVPIEATFADGSILVTDPIYAPSNKFFKNLNEADLFIKGIIRKYVHPKIKFMGRARWAKATRGVLMKYKSKKILIKPPFLKKRPIRPKIVPSLRSESTTLNAGDAKRVAEPFQDKGVRVVVSRKLVPSNQPRFTNQKVLQTSIPQLVNPVTHPAQSVNTQTSVAQGPSTQAAKSQYTEEVKNVVGTFKNMIEAASYIEKNYSTTVVQAQTRPIVTATPAAIVPPGIRPGQPVPQGAKLMSIQTKNGWATVMIRGPVPAAMSHKVRPLMVNNVRMSTNSPGFVKVNSNQLVSSVAGSVRVLPGATVTTTPAAVRKFAVPATLAAATAPLELPSLISPNTDSTGKPTFPLIAVSKATGSPTVAMVDQPSATVSVPSSATKCIPSATVSIPSATISLPTAAVSVPSATVSIPTAAASIPTATLSLPSATIVPTFRIAGVAPIRIKKKLVPRRAEVIVPRNEAFATVISPTPTSSVTTTTSKPNMSAESKVLYNGVVVSKPDTSSAPVKGFVCEKKSSPTKMTSLLPQKTPKDLPSL